MKVDTQRTSPFDQKATFTDGDNTLKFDIAIIAGETWCDWYVTSNMLTFDDVGEDRIDHQATELDSLTFDCDEPEIDSEDRHEEGATAVAGMATFAMRNGAGERRYLTLVNVRTPDNEGQAWSYTTPQGTQSGEL